ncbi:MAG: FAD-dependent monooxygenase [Sedimentitalea sp.]
MQYHENGFRAGDPNIAPKATRSKILDHVDVLIVGCGPAGLTLAAQLAAFPDITTRICERKAGPLEMGQADGIACRSMEMFQAFGFVEKVLKEAYWVNETTFWRPETGPNAGHGIARADRIQDVEDDLSEMPHVILSQARIHDFFLETMANSPTGLTPDYNHQLSGLRHEPGTAYPIVATFDHNDTGETIRARYVVGCDGARSAVREAMGQRLEGHSNRQLWGVMDILARTDFPDIRFKCAIQSADQGSLMLIPREGGHMVRLYIELDALAEGERAADRNVTSDQLIAQANRIFAPYTLDVQEVVWCSAYEIGQRVCDAFDDVPEAKRKTTTPRIFIAGDACHTHSPKAGQGMNVSMADAFNLGWKLASVLRGQASEQLLLSYSDERRAKAKELIDFDRDMANLFSAKPKTDGDAATFQTYFKTHGRYTAGVATRYDPSLITLESEHQTLAQGQIVGKRFHSAPVIRLGDGKPMQLSQALRADGRWRLIAFAPQHDTGAPGGAIAGLCHHLEHAPGSPVRRYTPVDHAVDSVIDVRAVFQQSHHNLDLAQMPALLTPTAGRLELRDYEKLFCPDFKSDRDIFDLRGIDRAKGALVVVRPDQYISAVLRLDDMDTVDRFFARFMIEPPRQSGARSA